MYHFYFWENCRFVVPSVFELNSFSILCICFVLFCSGTAFFIPPKQAQALLQGGSFVFHGSTTIYAHYDPSTAAHASIDRVLEVAKRAAAGHGAGNQ
jgi:hypothetical protein